MFDVTHTLYKHEVLPWYAFNEEAWQELLLQRYDFYLNCARVLKEL